MITTSREGEFTAIQEGKTLDGKNPKASSSSIPWTRLKDPRIVRVSRAFGGKDRHSKVCTVKGLRDRRVRLSVPTAIQLYDLQERLGLNQPSKVVDWLLNATKHEIDKLPPLQMPLGNFGQNVQALLSNDGFGASQFNKEGLKINNNIDWDDPLALQRSNYWISDATLRDKSKEVAKETADEKENWNQRNKEEKQSSDPEGHGANMAPNYNFFPRPSYSSIPGLLNNAMPHNSLYGWNPSNFSLSHIGSQTEDLQNLNAVSLPSTLSLPSGSQFLVCPPGTAQSYFPSHVATSAQFDPKQINNFQMLSSSSQNPLSNSLTPTLYSIGQSMRPLHLSMASKLFPSPDCIASQSNNTDEFPPK